jgi:hypothetical protein
MSDYKLVLRPLASPIPPEVRLRRALKYLLRSCDLRAIDVQTLTADLNGRALPRCTPPGHSDIKPVSKRGTVAATRLCEIAARRAQERRTARAGAWSINSQINSPAHPISRPPFGFSNSLKDSFRWQSPATARDVIARRKRNRYDHSPIVFSRR